MKAQTKARISQIARAAITIDTIFTAILWGLAILVFFTYAIYSAAHHIKF
jgi:hypothetical protein